MQGLTDHGSSPRRPATQKAPKGAFCVALGKQDVGALQSAPARLIKRRDGKRVARAYGVAVIVGHREDECIGPRVTVRVGEGG